MPKFETPEILETVISWGTSTNFLGNFGCCPLEMGGNLLGTSDISKFPGKFEMSEVSRTSLGTSAGNSQGNSAGNSKTQKFGGKFGAAEIRPHGMVGPEISTEIPIELPYEIRRSSLGSCGKLRIPEIPVEVFVCRSSLGSS